MKKELMERLKYYCAGQYYADIESETLTDELEFSVDPEDVKNWIENDAEDLLCFIEKLKRDKLI